MYSRNTSPRGGLLDFIYAQFYIKTGTVSKEIDLKLAECPKCKSQIPTDQYQPELMNTERLSLVSIAHDKGIDCPSCGEYLIPAIQAVNLDVGLVAHPRPQSEQRVLPVASLPFKLVQHGT